MMKINAAKELLFLISITSMNYALNLMTVTCFS